MPKPRPQLELIAPTATPEEAAAIVAALERFMRATAPLSTPPPEGIDPWQRASIEEGVRRGPWVDIPDPWINT